MSRYYRAVAVDYDGTLTESDTPSPEVLAAIRRVRGAGRLVVLVTGRILDSLLTSFPEAELAFDAIVGENGGVIWLPGKGRRAVAQPVAGELDAALAARGVPVERGSVLDSALNRRSRNPHRGFTTQSPPLVQAAPGDEGATRGGPVMRSIVVPVDGSARAARRS